MNALINKLDKLLLSLEKFSKDNPNPLNPELDRINNVINNITKSFSGSWLGYHSQVYYKNFKIPPSSAFFSVEWGLNFLGENGTVGEWRQYNQTEVNDYIYKMSKINNLDFMIKISEKIKTEFIDVKEILLSITNIYNDNQPNDTYFRSIIKKIEECNIVRFESYLKYCTPEKIASRDIKAASGGIRNPAHIVLYCQLLEIQEPLIRCNQMRDIVSNLKTHFFNKGLVSISKNKTVCTNKIFIVHGHDSSAKNDVARLIESFGLEAIILHEQVDNGNTIIEKLEKHTDVGFGVILYTPCDFGGSNKNSDDKRNRARQNVVFEHGYLIAKLGRKRVCALVTDSVEYPSDINGIMI